ncbi:unnamed protein product [Cuscuta epithymum]|uniref:Peptidase C1A papain C-terminal domain-containing protein n=1 Tax=Cuscuta epithymum TaxID=186058 RepID=A0AAV0D7U4_9ASTE|nr:unnamed protein product [Cuscuta epithymum]
MKNYGVTAKSEYDERAEIEENVNIQQMTRYRPMTITNIVNSPNLKKELRMYPLVGVMAAGETLYDYKCNDIYALKGPADHAVILTGYGVVGKQPVFEFKNSWGPDWGSKGYGLIHCDAILDIWKPSNIDVVMPDEET